MLSDFLTAMSIDKIVTTILSALVFGFFALGQVISSPGIAQALGDAKYSVQVSRAVLVVLMVFTLPNLILSLVGLDGPTGRAFAQLVLAGVFCLHLDAGIRLRVRWAKRTRLRRQYHRRVDTGLR